LLTRERSGRSVFPGSAADDRPTWSISAADRRLSTTSVVFFVVTGETHPPGECEVFATCSRARASRHADPLYGPPPKSGSRVEFKQYRQHTHHPPAAQPRPHRQHSHLSTGSTAAPLCPTTIHHPPAAQPRLHRQHSRNLHRQHSRVSTGSIAAPPLAA
jgi:hypothetical protein